MLHTRINSKRVKDLNVENETIDVQGENMRIPLYDVRTESLPMNQSPEAINEKIDKPDYKSTKYFSMEKVTISKGKR